MSTTIHTEMGPLHITEHEIASELHFPWTARNLVIFAFVAVVAGIDLYSDRGTGWMFLAGLGLVLFMNYARTKSMRATGTIRRDEVQAVGPYRKARYLLISFMRDGKAEQYYYQLKTKEDRNAALTAFYDLGYPKPE